MVHFLSAFLGGGGAARADAVRRRNLFAVSLAGFLASVGFMIVMPWLPTLVREVNGGESANYGLWLGLAISASPFLSAVTAPFWGAVSERFGRKAMIQRSLVCIGIGIGLLAIAALPIHVVVLRAMIGGLGGVSVAALAAITATTPRRELGPAVGTLQAAQTAGSMVGPLLGGLLGGIMGMRESFVVSAVIFAATILLVQWLYRESDPPVPAETAGRPTRGGATTRGSLTAVVVLVLAAAFVVQFVEGTFIILLPLQLERLGAQPSTIPWLFGLGLSLGFLANTIAAAYGGRLVQRRSASVLLCASLGLGIAVVLAMTLVQVWWQFFTLRVLLALVVGAGPTLAYSSVAGVPPEQRGRMVGLVSSVATFGWAASPLTAGAIAQIDATLLLILDIALLAIVAAAMLIVERGIFGRLPRVRPSLSSPLPNVVGARELIGRLPGPSALLPRPRRVKAFTSEEVLAALRGATRGERTDAILEMAARASEWMPLDPRTTFAGLARYGERLPTILFRYRRGDSVELIGEQMSLLGGRWSVERSLEIAGRLIADRLNRK